MVDKFYCVEGMLIVIKMEIKKREIRFRTRCYVHGKKDSRSGSYAVMTINQTFVS